MKLSLLTVIIGIIIALLIIVSIYVFSHESQASIWVAIGTLSLAAATVISAFISYHYNLQVVAKLNMPKLEASLEKVEDRKITAKIENKSESTVEILGLDIKSEVLKLIYENERLVSSETSEKELNFEGGKIEYFLFLGGGSDLPKYISGKNSLEFRIDANNLGMNQKINKKFFSRKYKNVSNSLNDSQLLDLFKKNNISGLALNIYIKIKDVFGNELNPVPFGEIFYYLDATEANIIFSNKLKFN